MKDFQSRYLELLLQTGAMRFGEFTTKSGRISPYFFDSGRLDTGPSIAAAADCYAELIAGLDIATGQRTSVLFGPAYKGIPLAVAASEALSRKTGRDIGWLFNRKEAKDHGEGGSLVGHRPSDNETVSIIEDVLTGGTSVRETFPLLSRYNIKPNRLIVGIDREERGTGNSLARQEVANLHGLTVHAILTMTEIVTTLSAGPVLGKVWIDETIRRAIEKYRSTWGVLS